MIIEIIYLIKYYLLQAKLYIISLFKYIINVISIAINRIHNQLLFYLLNKINWTNDESTTYN